MSFKAGDYVEVRVNSVRWFPAFINRRNDYRLPQGRGVREGYDFSWDQPANTPSWVSRGGWAQASCIRPYIQEKAK